MEISSVNFIHLLDLLPAVAKSSMICQLAIPKLMRGLGTSVKKCPD